MSNGNMFAYNLLFWQSFWLIITFSIIFLYMKFLFVPRIETNISTRNNHILQLNTELQHIKQEIYKIETSYVQQNEILDKTIKDNIEQLYMKYQQILEDTKKNIEQETLLQKAELELNLKKHTFDIEQSFVKYSDSVIAQYDMTYLE